MAVKAGSIITQGNNAVIDRIQSAGLNDTNTQFDTIREVGNPLVVDKVAQDPDYTFSIETWDVSTDIEAMLTGAVAANLTASGSAPGATDPDGTAYSWADVGYINIPSPWKSEQNEADGNVVAGHIVPGYYPTRIQYQFGVTDNASTTIEIAGGSYYYGAAAPVEDFFNGDGSDKTFATSHAQVRGHRVGGEEGTTWRYIFGVIVDGVLMREGSDYTVSASGSGKNGGTVTLTFIDAPKAGTKNVRFTYFTGEPQAFPQSVHPDVRVKPGAVRGRNIKVYVGEQRLLLPSLQSISLEATIDGEAEREMGTPDVVGRTINGTDANGSVTVRARDAAAFIRLLSTLTGVAEDEIYGFQNLKAIPLEIAIENPKNPGEIIKTLYAPDAIFAVPGTPARVNSPTDFTINYGIQSGNYYAIKGARV